MLSEVSVHGVAREERNRARSVRVLRGSRGYERPCPRDIREALSARSHAGELSGVGGPVLPRVQHIVRRTWFYDRRSAPSRERGHRESVSFGPRHAALVRGRTRPTGAEHSKPYSTRPGLEGLGTRSSELEPLSTSSGRSGQPGGGEQARRRYDASSPRGGPAITLT